ncbi:MAG: hypothetical protein IK114_13540 [Fibrobacter sp.]|nr:hypothetical protein [Fibrobacter sp.]
MLSFRRFLQLMEFFMPSENAIIERAEMYLRKLSCGINPLTDEILPEGDSCKQERISKCLAYVASLLQQQLNHDHVAPLPAEQPRAPKRSAKPAMQDLAIDTETLKGYRFFDYPVSISRVVRNINELLPKNMNHLLYADVANFLVQEGILERQSIADGNEANLPTAKGETYGFEKGESDLRGHHNIYTQCWQQAQQFILDNIQKCIAIANERFANRKAAQVQGDDQDAAPKRVQKEKFKLTAEQIKDYPAEDTPVPVSEIARRLNALVSDNMERIYYKVIRDWYVEQGYLEFKTSPEGRSAFLPTEKGAMSGLFVESRTGKDGELYDVVMYDASAQKIYLDHLASEN